MKHTNPKRKRGLGILESGLACASGWSVSPSPPGKPQTSLILGRNASNFVT
jgi:hypothetical protein